MTPFFDFADLRRLTSALRHGKTIRRGAWSVTVETWTNAIEFADPINVYTIRGPNGPTFHCPTDEHLIMRILAVEVGVDGWEIVD